VVGKSDEPDECLECGALIHRRTKHREWHEKVNAAIGLKAPEPQVPGILEWPEELVNEMDQWKRDDV